jgi:hypothetical protein
MTPPRPVHACARRPARLAALVLCTLPAFGFSEQGAPVAAVKAAFLFNFAKFTEWPELPGGTAIEYCVVGDDAVAAALRETVRGQHIAGRSLQVRNGAPSDDWHTCHILFVAESEHSRTRPGLASLKGEPVLTVSDAGGFAEGDGIAELYLEGGRMRFAINVPAAERAGLRLSSRLLSLAKVVRTAGVH